MSGDVGSIIRYRSQRIVASRIRFCNPPICSVLLSLRAIVNRSEETTVPKV